MSERVQRLTRLYDAYVDTYRDASGRLSEMMQLKRTHTAFVVRNAEAIAEGEGVEGPMRELFLMAALLHDTGRYEQLKRFNTFKDSDSIDHAVFSHDIVAERRWLDEVLDDPAERKTVLDAVLFHNRRELPEGLDARTEAVSHSVRDADKLDIFRVLEERLGNPAWRNDTRAFWNLEIEARPNPAVVEAIAGRRPVDYNAIKSLPDFVLIQVGWMISGLHFATSRRLCAERGHLEFRRNFLKTLTDDPAIDRLCDLAKETLAAVRTF